LLSYVSIINPLYPPILGEEEEIGGHPRAPGPSLNGKDTSYLLSLPDLIPVFTGTQSREGDS